MLRFGGPHKIATPLCGLENILPPQRVIASSFALFQSKPSSSGTFKVYQFCLAGVSRASGAFLYPRASGTFKVYQFCLAGVSRASGAFLCPRASGTFKNRYLRDYVSASLSAIVKTDKMQHRLTARRPFLRNNSAAQNPGGGVFRDYRNYLNYRPDGTLLADARGALVRSS